MGVPRSLFHPEVPLARAAAPETGQPPGEPRSIGDLIAEAIALRTQSFTLRDALALPAVRRGVGLLCSVTAAFSPVAYRDGVALDLQPRILRRPSPFGTLYGFLYGTMYGLLGGDETGALAGNAFWLVTSRDEEGVPDAVVLLPSGELDVTWADERRFLPRYVWRGHDVTKDVLHIALDRPAGALLGRSPVAASLDALATVDAAERYALGYFTTGGVPSVTLKVPTKQTRDEAEALKRQWMEAHNTPEPTPAVLSGGIEAEIPNVNAQSSQLQESRAYGATIAATILGIPAAMLLVQTSGATITYVNGGQALDDLVRSTIAPTYLPLIESALSELVTEDDAVRCDTRELHRTDLVTRFGIYETGIAAGILGPEDARTIEGWPRTGPITGQLFAPVPPAPAAPRPSEVPVA